MSAESLGQLACHEVRLVLAGHGHDPLVASRVRFVEHIDFGAVAVDYEQPCTVPEGFGPDLVRLHDGDGVPFLSQSQSQM